MELCPSIKNTLLLDSEGNRIAVKDYSDEWPTNSAKEAFEKAVFTKTQKTNARTEGSLKTFTFLLLEVKTKMRLSWPQYSRDFLMQLDFSLEALWTRRRHWRTYILFCCALMRLLMAGSIILETDANVIAGKVASHSTDAGAPLSEQTITQAFATAREHLTRSLLK